jgi:dTDP-4-dehydrorhamnose 3,5-epimerase-like enzyme
MKKLTPYQTFQDERGELVGLINQMHWEEFNYIESRAGSVRGNHYHKETQELFFIIEGEGRIEITTLAGDSQSMPFGAGDIFFD